MVDVGVIVGFSSVAVEVDGFVVVVVVLFVPEESNGVVLVVDVEKLDDVVEVVVVVDETACFTKTHDGIKLFVIRLAVLLHK